jgi:transcriptional regulator with XRE-family HTH domain
MIGQFFDKTLRRYGISGTQLAKVSGLSPSHISEFRNGKASPSCEVLVKLLDAVDRIAPGAKLYFCGLLAGSPMGATIDEMSEVELVFLLREVAERLEKINSKDSKTLAAVK